LIIFLFHDEGSDSVHARYGSLFLFIPGAASILATWHANNIAPQCRSRTGIAIIITTTNAGGILAVWLLGSLSPAPEYTKAAITFVVFAAGLLICALVDLYSQKFYKAPEVRLDGQNDLGYQSAWFIYGMHCYNMK
jgi:hypothetical protein